jgi:dTDP-4-amino-4,6-dideoxygalactose transaminase
MEPNTVKFLDLKAQYPLIKEEILSRINSIVENSAFVCGKQVKEFEDAFASYLGVKHCIAVNNGTSALLLTLMANKIGPSDEVILPVNTFIATAEAVSLVGATPVFVDINEKTYLIDPGKIEGKINKKTKAILPVHLFGQCADMDAIDKIAEKHKLLVIEDACQAHGSLYKGKKAGSLGICAAFSFYPGKNLGAWGEGGAVTTNNDKIAEKIRLIRDHGSKKKYCHEIIGGNFRIDEFQGAVLATKLKHLDAWNEKRRRNAEVYFKAFQSINNLKTKGIILPSVEKHNIPNWHLFVIRAKNRDSLIEHLGKNNIQTGIHYPFPLHLTEAYKARGYSKGDFPIAEKVQKEIISLPMYAELPEQHIKTVAAKIDEQK